MIFFVCAMVGHNPENNRLDFGGSQNLEPGPGIFLKEFYHSGIGNGKLASCVAQQCESMKASGPLTEQIKGCLGGGLH